MSDAAEFGYPGLAPTLQPTGNATKYIFIEPHLNNEPYIDFSFLRATVEHKLRTV